MTGRHAVLLALALLIGIAPAKAQTETVDTVFQTWLAAFNSEDEAAIQAFYAERLDDPDAAFALDSAEVSCGFDPVRVESVTATSMKVLLAEKCFPALQRLTIELGAPGEKKLKRFDLKSFALSLEGANKAIAGMAERLSKRDKFAGSLLIAHDGDEPWSQSWGSLDKTGVAPVTLETPMFLASAGKLFTAVSVLQLVEAGKIDLDAPLERYLTDYPNAETARVTVRQLLQHRGGTGDVGILARDEGANRARVRTIDDIIALNGSRAPEFPPGSKDEYSNYGFVLLGEIVERVSGESYYDYVSAHVFKPADMTNAGFPDRDHLEGIATGYTTYFGEEPQPVSNLESLPWRGMPAGGGVASANDMLKFFGALRSGKLLSPATLRLATTAGDTAWYGLGFVANSGKNASWGHGGVSYGMDVATHFYPGIHTMFICMASRDMACNSLINAWYDRVFGLTE